MAGEEEAQNSRGRGRGCYLRLGTRGARRLPGGDGGLGREDPAGSFTNSPAQGGQRGGGASLLNHPALVPWLGSPPLASPASPGRRGGAAGLSHRLLRPLRRAPPAGLPGPTPTQANDQAEAVMRVWGQDRSGWDERHLYVEDPGTAS